MILCFVRELKRLVPFSVAANLFIVASFAITLYYMFTDVPDIKERKLIAAVDKMPLFFSTVIFAMEGIGVVSTFTQICTRLSKRLYLFRLFYRLCR